MSTSLRFGSTASTPQMAAMASVAERQLTVRQSPTPDSQQSAPALPSVGSRGNDKFRGILPQRDAIVRLVGALLLEQSDE